MQLERRYLEKRNSRRHGKSCLKNAKKGYSDADILEITEISVERLVELKQQMLEPVH